MSRLRDKAKNFVTEKIANMRKPEASIDDVDLKGVNREGVTYCANVGVTNPYSHSIPICEITFHLKCDGRQIISGTIPDPGSIKGNDKTNLEVLMKVPHSVIVSLARDIFKDWDIDYELEIGLVIDIPIIGNFTIPLRKKGEIRLPSIKDFFRKGEDNEE
ncbi:late embryogenesis abundant protein Lea14-A-like [Chenopodium quinoa]|uniref:Water stress and hypersensitive response domain-containing protein n=1 Tax=Chenopodium quinoa TaxID=63459 RepID=A0A803M324_CHEQI|nr:late embryogenesis abundant protein Lea14-A-like [Chenopodium quinoa]